MALKAAPHLHPTVPSPCCPSSSLNARFFVFLCESMWPSEVYQTAPSLPAAASPSTSRPQAAICLLACQSPPLACTGHYFQGWGMKLKIDQTM